MDKPNLDDLMRLRDDALAVGPTHTRWYRCAQALMSALPAIYETAKAMNADAARWRQQEACESWRCFHCGDLFTDRVSARTHFGSTELQQPACLIGVAQYREMEELHRRHCEEDADLHRALHAAQADAERKARAAEEAGYARGLADAKLLPPPILQQVGYLTARGAVYGGIARAGVTPLYRIVAVLHQGGECEGVALSVTSGDRAVATSSDTDMAHARGATGTHANNANPGRGVNADRGGEEGPAAAMQNVNHC